MSTGPRFPFEVAHDCATELWRYLAPACERIDIAGSVRRLAATPGRPRGATCGDIELVCAADLGRVLTRLRRVDHVRDLHGGERLQEFRLYAGQPGRWIPVQLHFARSEQRLGMAEPASNYGWKLALATGPADWNRAIVTPRSRGGLLPAGLQLADGMVTDARGELLDVPTELRVFALWGLPYTAPADRSAVAVAQLREGAA